MENLDKTGLVDVSEEALEAEKNIGKNNNGSSYSQTVFDTKNYLNIRLEEGETQKTLRIRLLPFPETKTPFIHIYMHSLRVPLEISKSGWKSYVCLEKTDGLDPEKYGKKCPFCEIAKQSFTDMKKEVDPAKRDILKERGKDNIAKEAVVMRCIERGKEEEGVKFLKVNVHQTKDDLYNLIYTLWETRRAEWLADPENEGKDRAESNILSVNPYGYDLQITIKKKKDKNKYGQTIEKTSYQVTDAKKPSPLSESQEQIMEWVRDPKKWFDVFVPKPYDYLAIVMQGRVPWYDRTLGKWVSKEEDDERRADEEAQAEEEIREAERLAGLSPKGKDLESQLTEDPVGVFDKAPEDDLPF